MAKTSQKKIQKMSSRIRLAQKIQNNMVVDSVGSQANLTNKAIKSPNDEIASLMELLSRIAKESTQAVIEARKSIASIKQSIEKNGDSEVENTSPQKKHHPSKKRHYPP